MLKTMNVMGVRTRKTRSIFAALMLSRASFSSCWMKLMSFLPLDATILTYLEKRVVC